MRREGTVLNASFRKAFRVPLKIRRSDADPQTKSPIMRLNADVLFEILSLLDHEDHVAFSLTCKVFVNTIPRVLKMRITCPSELRHFPGGCLISNARYYKFLERIAPKTSTGKLRRAWRVCSNCRRLRPTAARYWHSVMDQSQKGMAALLSLWKRRGGCPDCETSGFIFYA